MHRTFVIFRDPRAKHVAFLTGMPPEFSGIVDEATWRSAIEGLNGLMAEHEKPSFLNFLRGLLIIPALVTSRAFERDVCNYLDKANKALAAYGVRIENPTEVSCFELTVTMGDRGATEGAGSGD